MEIRDQLSPRPVRLHSNAIRCALWVSRELKRERWLGDKFRHAARIPLSDCGAGEVTLQPRIDNPAWFKEAQALEHS